jgi:hypothetical protein
VGRAWIVKVAKWWVIRLGSVKHPHLPFSNIYDTIQKGKLVVTCTVGCPSKGREPSASAQKGGSLPITASIKWIGIHRSGAHVWTLSWPFLAYIEQT